MISQILTSTKYAILALRRNPAASFFTIVFPLMFLLLFGFIFGDELQDSGATIATFQVPGILTLSIVSATFINLAMGGVIRRESGQLKRLRGTPVRPTVWVIANVLAALAIVALMTVILTVVGRLFFGVAFNMFTLPWFVLIVFVGSITFSALGLAITAVIPNVDAAPAITNFAVFPLYFVSDVFIQTEGSDGFIGKIGDFFPIKPLARLLQPSYNPFVESVDMDWGAFGVVCAWGIAGIVAAIRFFRWLPQQDRG